ncbi:ABC transporter ATP-binding protein [Thetidibacter halocola]|uniref:ATP-binding cassette domain-containing protein n=1 Tax=Thetidibacter halocola TaxID=2827239 RepID=A0A8J7WEB0_9RHOB|nr:ABC transporter ATP-binding protein [Thetidibacter halocola]MBS0123791.1 ATP-binding cassette domain-containing protein [Thetidibacter halocola]
MLEVSDLSVAYGQHPALNGASLRVKRGEIVVILGANGAGKSTLLKAISGICEGRVSGSVTLEGEELVGLPPHRIVEAGVALVPEGRGVFGDLTVMENLLLGAYAERAREEEAGNLDRVLSLFPKLGERRGQQVRTMSGGEQQMVAIGRAMMSNPALLTLDEPSLGLSPLLSKELFQSLKAVRDTGIGILLVEQNARASLAIADRGYLLENTRIIHEDSAAKLRSDPAVQAAYLGGGKGAAKPAPMVAKPAAPRPSAPRPAAGPSPAQIAAAAMSGFQTNRAPRSEPAPKPQPVAERPRAPAPPPPPKPAAPPLPPRASAADAILGRSVADLVAKAAESSRARVGTGVTPRPAPRPAQQDRRPAQPMPDPRADSSDRLKSVLAEIEDAAARARAWRPDTHRK